MTDDVFDPDIKVTSHALARKEKFRKNKKQYGLAVKNSALSKTKKIYFNSQGEITCITRDRDYPIDPDWETYDFTADEIRLLSSNQISKFKVIKHDETNMYTIVSALNPHNKSRNIRQKFVEFSFTNNKDPEICVKLSKSKITIYLTDIGVKNFYKYADKSNRIHNKGFMPLFITANNDPNFLIESFDVSLADLAAEHQVIIDVSEDYTQSSVYTVPMFISHGRV